MIKLLRKFTKNFNKIKGLKFIWESIYLGFQKANSIPLLPKTIEKIYSLFFIRVLRFIGGLCLLLAISKTYTYFPEYIHILILILGILQSVQMTIILFINVVYGVYIVIFKPELFEVRISSKNK